MKTTMKSGSIILAIVFVIIPLKLVCGQSVYHVGPGRTYENFGDLLAVVTLRPGDIVEVDGDRTYPGGVMFGDPGAENNPITIRGIKINGNKPLISGGINIVHFQTDSPEK